MSKLSRGNKNFFSFVLRHKRCSPLDFFILIGRAFIFYHNRSFSVYMHRQ